ncbi:ATP-binding protein [Candidatus Uabimicrobium amorphum]|uniref:Fe-S oxidoreductase n=1 Tax=Uabimicrobium amorphum TaxID=2596890 RepID=A0A5S9IQX8_UABAM|nr:ferredoxin family protein [Candidatus Uabimicrobium amorphum]BBM86087.1 Fe-S oxidoreductase [Candidatus Uabimicrobium amorphum]
MTVTFYQNEANDLDKKYSALCDLLQHGHHVTCTSQTQALQGSSIVVGEFAGDFPQDVEQLSCPIVDLSETPQVMSKLEQSTEKPWKPWFPVIDYDRCTNCMQCMNFCLFGVYGLSNEQKLQVQTPQNCKTECPACSRVCPEAAIMFPKYKAGPINGDEVSEEDLNKEKMKVDISSLLGGNIYDALRQRSERAQSRFAKERDEDRALKERKRCLKKLQKDLDIPDEVLNSLPIPKHLLDDSSE